MLQPKISCTVCGGTDFTADAGSFFCLECNTQSQDLREEVFDEYFGTQKATTTRLSKKKEALIAENSDENEKLTSWEVLNYVLKGMVDELLTFGATPELKVVTLQLWASYLRRLEVAFTSVVVERKPKLGFVFKRRDAEIIYGVTRKQLKEKRWRPRRSSKSNASSTSGSDSNAESVPTNNEGSSRRAMLLKLARRKKALASAEYSNMPEGTSKSFSHTLESLDSSDGAETPKRMKLTKHAKSMLSSSLDGSMDDNEKRLMVKSETYSLRNVTKTKIAAIVCLALALTRQEILVSDFIRWVDEGYISLGKARKYLPAGMKLDFKTHLLIEIEHLSHTKCQGLMDGLCRELGISNLPAPDLTRLTDRYCLEMQLPHEVTAAAQRILILTKAEDTSRASCHVSCHWEVRVMSAILVVLKLFFSLDDCTEYRLSRTAAEINGASRGDNENFHELFVWSDWVWFIECRKAVVSSFHQPIRSAVYGDTFGSDSQLFLHHLQQTMGDQPLQHLKVSNRFALNQTWASSLCRCLKKLSELHNIKSDGDKTFPPSFPPSLTPLHSCTQLLLLHHKDRLAPAVIDILGQDFTKKSLEYILQPDKCIAIGLTHDLNIIQKEKVAADFKIGKIQTKNKDRALPRFKLNQVNLTVKIVDNLEKSKICKNTDCETENSNDKDKLPDDLKEIISDDSDSDEDEIKDEIIAVQEAGIAMCHTDLELFNTGSGYWVNHFSMSKNLMSQDDFEQLAIREFPSSFWWLLKECARVIGVATKELYANMVAIEKKHESIITNAGKHVRSRKRKRY